MTVDVILRWIKKFDYTITFCLSWKNIVTLSISYYITLKIRVTNSSQILDIGGMELIGRYVSELRTYDLTDLSMAVSQLPILLFKTLIRDGERGTLRSPMP